MQARIARERIFLHYRKYCWRTTIGPLAACCRPLTCTIITVSSKHIVICKNKTLTNLLLLMIVLYLTINVIVHLSVMLWNLNLFLITNHIVNRFWIWLHCPYFLFIKWHISPKVKETHFKIIDPVADFLRKIFKFGVGDWWDSGTMLQWVQCDQILHRGGGGHQISSQGFWKSWQPCIIKFSHSCSIEDSTVPY